MIKFNFNSLEECKQIKIISDCHFGHKNIIKYANRPFSNVDEMNAKLIENWNYVIKKHDIILHCGDFSLMSVSKTIEIIKQLNGRKYFLKGNHDSSKILKRLKKENLIINFDYYAIVKIFIDKNNSISIFLSHFPHYEFVGHIHLFGHTHGSLNMDKWRQDTGNIGAEISVDVTGFKPISLYKIILDLLKI